MIDLLKSGDLERLFIVVVVFLLLAFLLLTDRPIDDRVFDLALVILGYFFGQMTAKVANHL